MMVDDAYRPEGVPTGAGEFPIETPPHRASAVVSSLQLRLLVTGLVLTVLLMGAEIAHYLIATDLSVLDATAQISANHHPECQERGSPYSLRCPQIGYNSVTMICWEFRCYYGDPNLPTITEPMRERRATEINEDAIRSLRVELPYSSRSEEWQRNAQSLASGHRASTSVELPLNQQAKTIPDAQLLVLERSLAISRQTAEEWMKQHGH